MNVLVVGAGAVGQVYGYHLQLAGADISFLVKPKYLEACRAGFVLHPLRGKPSTVRFRAGAMSDFAEVKAREWDQVWLCVPTDAAEDDVWLTSLASAVGDATVVSLMPGMHVPERLRRFLRGDRLVTGVIGMISYQTPLPGDPPDPEPGIAYMFPPANKTMLAGPGAREAVALLRRGKCPAKETPNAFYSLAMGSAVLMCNIVGLEASDWSLRKLRAGSMPKLVAQAAREAQAVVGARIDAAPPWWRPLLRGLTLRVLWMIGPWLMPFNVEVYLKYHFSKVRPQTALLFKGYLSEARARNLEVPALAELYEMVFASPDGTS